MDEKGMLKIKVTDEEGNLMPCRLHMKQQDGSCWIPPDVREPKYTDSEAPDLHLPSHYSRYLHLCQETNLQSVHLNHGSAQIPVPVGELQLFLARGHEYIPLSDDFTIKAGQTLNKEYVLRRLLDLPKMGWYGGDMHTHFSRWQPSDDHVFSRLLLAEGLHAVNNMVYKQAGIVEAPQYAYGEEGEHRIDDHHFGHHIIASGEEFRDNDLYGHMIAAGIREVIEPISVGHQLGRRENYPLFASVCDWAHEQGGIAGWAHGGTMIKLFESLPIEAALGKLDFVENIQFNMFYGFMFWYRLLNCGIRLAGTGGSDFPFSAALLAPWYPNLGLDRTYVQIGDEFAYSSWIDGIRHGQTFASNGPLLFLTVNEKNSTQLQLPASQDRVLVEAKAVCNYGLDCLEIVANGAVIKHVEGKGGQTEITCAERIRLDGSSWFAARTRGRVAPEGYGGVSTWNLHAHTSPIYVLRGDKPIGVKSDLTAMADYVRMVMEIYGRRGQFTSDAHRQELMTNCEKALTFYEHRLFSS